MLDHRIDWLTVKLFLKRPNMLLANPQVNCIHYAHVFSSFEKKDDPTFYTQYIKKGNIIWLKESRRFCRCEHINRINETIRCLHVLQTLFLSITVWHWPSAFTVLACVWYRVIIGLEQRQIKLHQAILLICKSTSFGYQRLVPLCTFCLSINTLIGLQQRMRSTVHPNGEGKRKPITDKYRF